MGRNKINDNEKVITKQFGVKLKKLLKIADITQAQMAKDLSLSKTSVNTWVNGSQQPQFIQLRKIIIYLLKNENLTGFYPIDLLVPDFIVDSSETEKELLFLKEKLISENYSLRKEIELLKKENIILKNKLMAEEELETKRKSLIQEKRKINRLKKTYKDEVKKEMTEKQSCLKLWSPKAVSYYVLEALKQSGIVPNGWNKMEMCDYICEELAKAIVTIIHDTFPMLKP